MSHPSLSDHPWIFFFNLIYLLFLFLGLHLRHMEVPRLGAQIRVQLPAHTTATVMRDPSHICDLCHSSQQCWILNPLSKTRDGTLIFMDTNQVHNQPTEPQWDLPALDDFKTMNIGGTETQYYYCFPFSYSPRKWSDDNLLFISLE